jgi:hypothetical protein
MTMLRMRTETVRLPGVLKGLAAGLIATVVLCGPALADDWRHDEGHHRGWDQRREHEEHERWEHERWAQRHYYAPPPVVVAAPPQAVYMAPAPVVVAPAPIVPGVQIVLPINIR